MRDDSVRHSVSVIVVSVAILAITVAGVLFYDLYSRFTSSSEERIAGEFDPGRYPSPSAGIAVKQQSTLDCNDVVYGSTKSGIKYVREAGGGVLIGAEYRKKFGFYKIKYGALSPVEGVSVDIFTGEKLKYALYNCDGPFLPSGIIF